MKTAVEEAREAHIKIGEYKRLIKDVQEMRESQKSKGKKTQELEIKVDQKLKEIL